MFHQAVWCRKHKAGNKVGLYMAKGSPQQSPFQAAASSSVSTALSKRTQLVQLPKVWVFFFALKYQNYKKSVYKLFFQNNHQNKTIPQIKILSKVLITLLLTLKPSTHSHVMGKRRERGLVLGDHLARRFPREAMVSYLRTMEWVTAVLTTHPFFLDQGEPFQIELEELSEF